MARSSLFPFLLAGPLLICLAHPTFAQTSGGTTDQQSDDEEAAATQAPLTVGSMAIASDAALVVESMAVDVGVDQVTYTYKFKNKGKNQLALAASVAMPDLEVNSEGTTVYNLPSQNPDNPVKLDIRADGQPARTTSYMQATALGIDRLADIKDANIPLIPFGDETDKAIAAAKPETLLKLEALGLLTPRDPTQPDTPMLADWTLSNVVGWTLTIAPGATSSVAVTFAPVKAVYTIDAASLRGFDALKAQVCLTPQIMTAAAALLKAKGSTADVADITLANDGPARWLDNPDATVAVHKPKPNSVVVFCGMDATSGKAPTVQGKMPNSDQAAGLRVLIFSPHDKG